MDLVQSEVSASAIRPLFLERFGHQPTVIAAAPGRVNLIGEHTDYNNGFVMPMALECYTIVAVAASPTGNFRLSSTLGNSVVEITPQDVIKPGEPFWTNYLRGVIANLKRENIEIDPVDILVDSNVPRGGGLSSSAALEISTITALLGYAQKEMNKKDIAFMGQRVEHEFASVPCGIMDQFISANGKAGHALKLDCKSMEGEHIPMDDPSISVLILDSAVKHSLADGAYALRRQQCEDAAKILGTPSLREATLEQVEAQKDHLGDVCYRRARHVVGENARVEKFAQAIAQKDYEEAGAAMRGSHASLRDDYEVSCAEVDTLVSACDHIPSASAVYGARMTGGGFGGCIVALVRTEKVDQVAEELLSAYRDATGIETTYLITRAGDGARLID